MFYFCHLVGNFRRKQLLPWSQQLKDRRVRKFKILGVFSLWCQDGDYISSIESSHQGQDLKDIPPSSPKSAPFRELSRKPHWTFSTYMSWATPLQRKMGSVPFFFFFLISWEIATCQNIGVLWVRRKGKIDFEYLLAVSAQTSMTLLFSLFQWCRIKWQIELHFVSC